MLTRTAPGGYLVPREDSVPAASTELEELGITVVKSCFSSDYIGRLREEIESVYDRVSGDDRGHMVKDLAEDFRYEMFNRSPLALEAVASREILDVIEPLLGEDCHIIANTCWRNPSSDVSRHGGGGWHIDAGPHIPLQEGQIWPVDIPHPVFAIGVHLFLQDCPVECGPTGAIPGSHKSGRFPPQDRRMDDDLTYNGVKVRLLTAKAGDVAFFVSDVWHRRMPPHDKHDGRFFLQIHYGRRDIAQRVKATTECNHVDPDALAWITNDRQRLLLGLHRRGFYDG